MYMRGSRLGCMAAPVSHRTTRALYHVYSATCTLPHVLAPYPQVPQPRKYLVTRWEDEPYSRGVYSHIALGATTLDYDAMAEPLWEERLLWAGEATCKEHPATVAGAYISGMREAARVCCRLRCEANQRAATQSAANQSAATQSVV
jgi:hypothetical protein